MIDEESVFRQGWLTDWLQKAGTFHVRFNHLFSGLCWILCGKPSGDYNSRDGSNVRLYFVIICFTDSANTGRAPSSVIRASSVLCSSAPRERRVATGNSVKHSSAQKPTNRYQMVVSKIGLLASELGGSDRFQQGFPGARGFIRSIKLVL